MSKYIMRFDGTEYAFLSNFYPSVIKIANWYLDNQTALSYPTVENTYQAAKTLNREEQEAIRNARTPGEAKRLGKRCTLREDWEDIKDDVMLDLLQEKFSDVNPELKQKLIDTGDAVLVEGNTWHDNHFGVCVCIKCGSVGENVLGKLLMQVRDEINADKEGLLKK